MSPHRTPRRRLALRQLAFVALVLVLTGDASRWTQASSGPDEPGPPARLDETGLYVAGRPGMVDPRNRPFSPQYPLWSDGATKSRWVFLPSGARIDAADPGGWTFPVGTRFWKEFRFDGRRVETRLLWKASPATWVAASYVWNEAGTEAVLAPDEGVPAAVEIAPGRRHAIPSQVECAACHGTARMGPLGFNPLQLSTDRDPNAIHGEPLEKGMMTLETLVTERLLSPSHAYRGAPPRIPARSPATRAVLGYLAANCGSCHDGSDGISVRMPSLHYRDLLRDGDAVAQSLVGHRTEWQVPGRPEGTSALVDPASPEASAILARMRSRRPSSQMPPLGTVIRDHAAVEAIAEWIATDLTP